MRTETASHFQKLQKEIVSELREIDPGVSVRNDPWDRLDGGYGGGGITCILENGDTFEKGGVNFSEVHGELPEDMVEKLLGSKEKRSFFATGVSIVIHSRSPMVPTVHANVRYLEVGEMKWFGGGTDLTPSYLFEKDAIHFHQTVKDACDKHDSDYYPRFKKWCDEYFFLPHRGEARGIGGIFFDYLGKDEPEKLDHYWDFTKEVGASFTKAFIPVVEARKDDQWGEVEKAFQLIRRGRYVEFNLIIDRGTLFGLKTGGRTESILMSLPPVVHWAYDHTPGEGSREAELLNVVRNPRQWL